MRPGPAQQAVYNARYYATDKGQQAYRNKRWRAKGIDPLSAQQALDTNDGTCDACGDEFTVTPHVDHDHNAPTPAPARGVLCPRCNMTLGMVQDNRDVLVALVDYLDTSPTYVSGKVI